MIDPAAVLAHPGLEEPYRFDARETMLHALATGIGMDPTDTDRLPFAYDRCGVPLQALPTLPIVLGWVDLVRDARSWDAALGIDPHMVVVGEAAIALHRPIPLEGEGISRSFFADVIDKGAGRGAMLLVRREVRDIHGVCLATVDSWLFVRGGGGFGGKTDGGPSRVNIPQRAADAVARQPTAGNAALLYRQLLRDHNAVHADPEYARRVGFDMPILHGLATFSMAIHSTVAAITGSLVGNAHRLESARARMSSPVFPGDNLQIETWRVAGGALFRAKVPDRDVTVIESGILNLAS